MQLFRSINGKCGALIRASARRYCAVAQSEEYNKRNYASNLAEYNTVMTSLTAQKRFALLRDAYDDMMLDGVPPTRDTFHSMMAGAMKGARMDDAFFYRDEMKAMGLVPDLALYNLLIATCGKCRSSEQAIRILEEMKRNEVKPTGQTFICLLNACAASGCLDRVYAIIRDMTAAGLGLNKFCYAGLIAAHKNKGSTANELAAKIIELVQQSKGWSEVLGNMPENVMMGVSLEELYNIPTAEFLHRRAGFVDRRLTVYHVAAHALADLRDPERMDTLMNMLQSDNYQPDAFITMCYLRTGDLDRGHKVFEDFSKSARPLVIELFVTLAEGAMLGHTPKGMQLAQDVLVNMNSRNFFLPPIMANHLLQIAAGEKGGGYTTANYIWDLMQARNITPFVASVEAYYSGLREREIPADDPRLVKVGQILNNLRPRLTRR